MVTTCELIVLYFHIVVAIGFKSNPFGFPLVGLVIASVGGVGAQLKDGLLLGRVKRNIAERNLASIITSHVESVITSGRCFEIST